MIDKWIKKIQKNIKKEYKTKYELLYNKQIYKDYIEKQKVFYQFSFNGIGLVKKVFYANEVLDLTDYESW